MMASIVHPNARAVVVGQFDGAAYVRYYDDLNAQGLTPDQGREHFAYQGIAQNRIGFVVGQSYGGRWDDGGYLDLHWDVAKNVGLGVYQSGSSHYQTNGWSENRKVRLVVDFSVVGHGGSSDYFGTGPTEVPPAAMTSNSQAFSTAEPYGTITVSASSTHASYPTMKAYKAFNKTADAGDTYDAWSSAAVYSATDGTYTGAVTTNGYAGEWLQITLPKQLILASFKVTPRTKGGPSPRDFKIFGSNDNSTWTELGTWSVIGWDFISTKLFISHTVIPYLHYRIAFHSMNTYQSYGRIFIGEWVLYGTYI